VGAGIGAGVVAGVGGGAGGGSGADVGSAIAVDVVDVSVVVVRPSQMSSHKTYASTTLELKLVLETESKK
jgi:hypothetical protein